MIYTLTLAPAIDLNLELDKITFGQVNRTKKQFYLVGGKGISVSMMLNSLGNDSKCLGFVGGYTGREIKQQLNDLKIKHDFVHTKTPTRINVVIAADQETNINSSPNPISKEEYRRLGRKLLRLQTGDILVIGGTLPKDLDIEYTKKILDKLKENGIKFIFDLSNEYLLKVGKYKPILVKPNRFELADIFKQQINNDGDIIALAKELLKTGCENVLVSKDKDGAILVNNSTVIQSPAAIGTVVSTTGAGDSMVAGFIDSYEKHNDWNKILADSIIAGSATAFSNGIANKEMVENVRTQVYKTNKIE